MLGMRIDAGRGGYAVAGEVQCWRGCLLDLPTHDAGAWSRLNTRSTRCQSADGDSKRRLRAALLVSFLDETRLIAFSAAGSTAAAHPAKWRTRQRPTEWLDQLLARKDGRGLVVGRRCAKDSSQMPPETPQYCGAACSKPAG